jgi:hypothetical protein
MKDKCALLRQVAEPCCALLGLHWEIGQTHKHLTYEDKVPQLSGSQSPNMAVELALAILGAVDVCMR